MADRLSSHPWARQTSSRTSRGKLTVGGNDTNWLLSQNSRTPALGFVVVQASTCAAAALVGTDAGWKPAPQ